METVVTNTQEREQASLEELAEALLAKQALQAALQTSMDVRE